MVNETALRQNIIMLGNYKNLLFHLYSLVFVVVLGASSTVIAQNLKTNPNIEEKSFTTSDGVKLHYLIGGHGDTTLFFIPGWLMPAEIFNGQLNFFSKNYRVISFSPRSQGKSQIYIGRNLAEVRARDIKELLEATHSEKFCLVGWSLGVMEALDFVARYGNKGLESMVLIDNSIGEGPPPSASSGGLGKMTTDKFISYAKGFTRAIFRFPPPDDFLRTVEDSTLRLASNPSEAFSILRKPYPREYYREAVYASGVPVWYAITPRYTEQALALSENSADAEFTIYEKAGHALFVDQADDFNNDMDRFLRKLN